MDPQAQYGPKDGCMGQGGMPEYLGDMHGYHGPMWGSMSLSNIGACV